MALLLLHAPESAVAAFTSVSRACLSLNDLKLCAAASGSTQPRYEAPCDASGRLVFTAFTHQVLPYQRRGRPL